MPTAPSGPLRTLDRPMENATWTIGPCSEAGVRALVDGARRLARRPRPCSSAAGYGDADAARAFLEGALPGHDPFALGDMRAAVEHDRGRGRRAARASACTATTTPTASARPRSPCCCCASSAPSRRGTCRRGSRRATGSRARRSTRLAADGVDLRADGRLRHHGRRRGRERRRALGLEVVVTDHHRPADTFPDVPGRRAAQGRRIRSPGCAAPASSGSSPRRCSAPGHRVPRRGTSTSSRSRRSPTSCRSSTRTARSRCSGCGGSRRRRSRACCALMRVAGVDPARVRRGRDRLPARAAHQRRRPARPPRGGARAAAHR